MQSPLVFLKALGLALLLFLGIGFFAMALIPRPSTSQRAAPSKLVAWGSFCLLGAGAWMYWDHKSRILTPDEEFEKFLSDVAKRFRHTRSLKAVEDEYRAKGATDDTLMMIRGAPQMLKARGDAKVSMGLQLLGVGLIFTAGAYLFSRLNGGQHYEVGITAIGGGIGFIILGIRQRNAFENRK